MYSLLYYFFIIYQNIVRPTVIKSLKRAGYPIDEIMKLTGHMSSDSIIRSYDHTIDDGDKVNMAAAIGLAPQLRRGQTRDTAGQFIPYL